MAGRADRAGEAGRVRPVELGVEEGLAADGEEEVVVAEEAAPAAVADAADVDNKAAALRAWGGCGACSE